MVFLVYICNISPPFKNITNQKNGINVVLYLFVIIKNIFLNKIFYLGNKV